MDVYFVNEFVEVILMASAEIDEGLDGLVWIGGDVLTLSGSEDRERVVGEGSEVGDGVVDIGGFVDADKGFVEDGEKVAEELEGDGLFDHGEHLGFVALPSIHLEELFEVGEELGALLHLLVDLWMVSSVFGHLDGLLTLSTALVQATYALKTVPICCGVRSGLNFSDRNMTTTKSMSSATASLRISFFVSSSALQKLFSFSQSIGSLILRIRESIDF